MAQRLLCNGRDLQFVSVCVSSDAKDLGDGGWADYNNSAGHPDPEACAVVKNYELGR